MLDDRQQKNALEYQKIKFSFDALVCGLVTMDALVMPSSSVSNDHQLTSVSKSPFLLPTEQSRQCQIYATTVKNDSLLTKLIKLEDRISSIAWIPLVLMTRTLKIIMCINIVLSFL